MKRDALEHLQRWWQRPRRKPLVIRGARQVGKSTLVRQFAVDAGLILNEINLEQHRALDRVFSSLDTGRIIEELSALLGRNVLASDTLLFLDEIQATPHALQALRYLYEERPEMPVVAAGSLLEFVLSSHSFSMPVGRVEYFHLGPVTFDEYLQAVAPDLRESVMDLSLSKQPAQMLHERLLAKQREFLLVGGMPEAVQAYVDSGQLAEVIPVHRSIVATYRDDFSKYASRQALARLQRVFDHVPRAVGRKVKYVDFLREESARETRTAIDLLARARVILPVSHSHCTGVPLAAEIDERIYKLLCLDVGLMNRMNGVDWRDLSALSDRDLVNEGQIAEQFIGQHLLYFEQGLEAPRLCYWLREGRSSNAEVDYVISCGWLRIPVEVKAGASGSLRSLFQFVLHHDVDLAVRFDLGLPSLQRVRHGVRQADGVAIVECDLLSLPLYLVGQLRRFVDAYRAGKARGQSI